MEVKRICKKCKIEKDLIDGFYERPKGTRKYNRQCKSCDNKAKSIWGKEKIRKRKAKYREKNIDKIKAQEKIYKEKHKDKIKRDKKEWYCKNKEAILLRQKKWNDENKQTVSKRRKIQYRGGTSIKQKEYKKIYNKKNREKISIQNKKYNIANKEKIQEIRNRRREREKNIEGGYLKKHTIITYKEFNNKCFNCKSIEKLSIDHHRPLSKGHALSLYNAVVLCMICNSSKGPKYPEEFYGEEKCKQLDKKLQKIAKIHGDTND